MSELWNDIDLDRHGVIEAHAGTGKTYTIVRLVLRMLERKNPHSGAPTHIRDVLVVTYTEKAAGELRKRIREGLDEKITSLSETDPLRHHFESCLNNLHEAYIGTIHSICLRLLQTWPFESGIHFDTTVVDDEEGLRIALRESMRTDWQNESTGIPWALKQFVDTGEQLGVRHFSLIRKTALELLGEKHSRLDRTIADNLTLKDFPDRFKQIRKREEMHFPEFDHLLLEFIANLAALCVSGKIDTTKCSLIYSRIKALQLMRDTNNFDLAIIENLIQSGRSKLITKAQITKLPLAAQADELARRIAGHPYSTLLAEKQTFQIQLLFSFIADSSDLLAVRWRQTKKNNGHISFQDMLHRMDQALRNSPEFTSALRMKIRYVIIDEFQDTSRIQWELFRHLVSECENGQSPRLYIVGDPKQSIYGFQGADVNSYLDARDEIRNPGETAYKLKNNYRSTKSLISGYNAIFASDDIEDDWFLFTDGIDGITYTIAEAVTAPDRQDKPLFECTFPPVQIIPLTGSPEQRKFQLAKMTCDAIKRLVGMRISLPNGIGWNNDFTVNYGDIAVIVEKHDLAVPFLSMFLDYGIPAVKYKMKGVFQSGMARALHALLLAVLHPFGNPAPRLAALLTPFFNRTPESIDPDHDLEPCDNELCRDTTLCIAHALEEWTDLADRGYWSQLFRSIRHKTGIEKRLIRLTDGERQLADLKQVIDYCIEQLYCDNMTLLRLVEHLADLLDESDTTGEDRNLHVLATGKSSVKVLTMHAAKGLEFPVVFVVTDKTASTVHMPLYWTDNNGIRNILPTISNNRDMRERFPDLATATDRSLHQMRQERRRLLYVALTRAQALLFVPMHLNELPENNDTQTSWSDCIPKRFADKDLTPRLAQLLDASEKDTSLALFDISGFPAISDKASSPAEDSRENKKVIYDQPPVRSLDLFSRICRQTSYSHLTREVAAVREIDHSEEPEEDTVITTPFNSPLPGGRATGDALHCAIEELLLSGNSTPITPDAATLVPIIEKYFSRNAIFSMENSPAPVSEEAISMAVAAAVHCLEGAFLSAIMLPGGHVLENISTLPASDRIPEMEFLFQVDRHWVHGYMDLVFRIPDTSSASHPWRYFVLDWKSDTLPVYDLSTIAHAVHHRHYDLQAKLYSHALHRYLQGILGDVYSPADHLGGAVYFFLREHEQTSGQKATVWTHTASVVDDGDFVNRIVIKSWT